MLEYLTHLFLLYLGRLDPTQVIFLYFSMRSHSLHSTAPQVLWVPEMPLHGPFSAAFKLLTLLLTWAWPVIPPNEQLLISRTSRIVAIPTMNPAASMNLWMRQGRDILRVVIYSRSLCFVCCFLCFVCGRDWRVTKRCWYFFCSAWYLTCNWF